MTILISLFITILSVFSPLVVFAHSQTQVIEMTENGFNPNSITVDENSTVIFLNKDSKAHWPASDIHPTHEIYPEFDPKKEIASGQSWSFRPKKVGSFRFHDHLYPHFNGILNVEAEAGYKVGNKNDINLVEIVKNLAKNIFIKLKSVLSFGKKMPVPSAESFIKLSPDEQFKTLKDLADNLGAEKAWQYVKDTYKGQSGSSGNIHDLAHLSGSLIYDKAGFDGITNCTTDFAFGCFHGFLDKAFAKSLDKLVNAQKACLKLDSSLSGPVASCIHGIGHGVASFYSVSDLKKSLSTCRKLTSGNEYCFDGVFMEFVRSAPENFFKKDDYLYPCDELEKEFGPTYSFSCARNQPALLMARFKLGFEEIIPICLSSNSTPFKQACFDALGFSLASSADSEKIISGCEQIQVPEFMTRCMKAAAGELVFQEVPNWNEKSQAVCKATQDGQDECIRYVDQLVTQYHRVRKINFKPNGDVRSQLKVCFDIGGRDDCYKQVAQVLYDSFGLSKTMQALKENEQYPEVYARCHEVTHYLSRSEYEKQKNIGKVYAQCDSTCHGGCYHGTLEAFLKEQQSKPRFNLNTEFAKVCGQSQDYQKPIEFNECLHGMGHAAMFVMDLELKESLKLCDTFKNPEHVDRCYTGVFMENSSSSTSFDHKSKYVKADDPFYPCNSLEEKYQSTCWQYQSSYFSILNHQNWQKVSQMCLQIPVEYQDKCFRTIGTNQVGFTSSLLTMKQDCDLMPDDHFKDICVAGVVSSLSYRFVGEAQKMIDFCLLVNADNKQSCFKQMGTGILDWDKNKEVAKVECNKVPDPKGKDWCLSVI